VNITRTSGPSASNIDLFEELLTRLQSDSADLEAFFAAHPGHAGTLRGLLPAAQALADLSASGEADGSIPTSPAAEPATGMLGDFRIVREVGRGGMGIVYEAEQISLDRRVALKVLPFASTMDAKQLQRFKNEAKAAASLKHEHIVSVYAVGCERGVHYYAMEFIDGLSLAQTIAGARDAVGGTPARPERTADYPAASLQADVCEAGARAPDAEVAPGSQTPATAEVAALSTQLSGPRNRDFYRAAARLIADAADALEHAHSLGIVHRDVKPGNLMVDQEGQVYVTDFGLARFGPDAGLTMSGDLLGTLRYLPPEQALARHGLVDHRADVYGLGCTLYELLTGRPAVDAIDRAHILRQIAFEDPPAPWKLHKSIPVELETITLKCLAKNPAERYATAGELADDLRRWLEDKSIKAKPPTLTMRAGKWARRHQPLVRAAAVVVLILAGSLGWIIRDWQARRTEAEGRVAEALAAAWPKLGDGNPHEPGLVSAALKAEAQLASGLLREEVRHRVEHLLADLAMLEKLEIARLAEAAATTDGYHFDAHAADLAYARAFRDYGIDVDALGVPEAAALIRARAIRLHLAAALDDWSKVRSANEKSDWKRLLAVAREADPDPWRCALRDALASGHKEELEKLLASAPSPELSPTTLALLGKLFQNARGRVAQVAVTVLRAGQLRYPDDFWINEYLALLLTRVEPPQFDEAIGFYRAALALRPQSPGAYVNLGNALYHHVLGRTGDWDGAIAAYREIRRLGPQGSDAVVGMGLNLGNALREKGHDLWERGDTEGAHVAYREALELIEDYFRRFPGDWKGPHNLAFFLATCRDGRLRDPGRAVGLSRREAELWPESYWSWHMLGMAHYYAGHALDAIPALERAAQIDERGSQSAWEWFHLALAHRQLGDLYRSTLYYAAGVRCVEEHAPADPRFRRLRAYAAAQLGMTGGANPAATVPRPEP
jgi:serine/threonine protein kinase/tetratricopeptide (TPR) repeat protein